MPLSGIPSVMGRNYHAAEAEEVYGRLWERLSGNLVVEVESRPVPGSTRSCASCGSTVWEREYRLTVRGARLEPGRRRSRRRLSSRGWGRAVQVTEVSRLFSSVAFESAMDPAAVCWCEVALALRAFEAALPAPGSPFLREP